jgi:16S rRNA (cytidine1402-2'-O)-methyltransferase
MSLTIVATPIGNPLDISQRAIENLQTADLVIGEEFKEVSKLLKSLKIEKKELRVLNEHSSAEDISLLKTECETKNAVLVSDCGTPNFCDPGFQLIKECRTAKIPIRSVPGASSLMMILSLTSERIYDFYFKGFLPANTEEREKALAQLKKVSEPIIVMDTPYRLKKLLADLQATMPNRKMLLGLDMTLATELALEGTPSEINRLLDRDKAEFMILIYKDRSSSQSSRSHSSDTHNSHRANSNEFNKRGAPSSNSKPNKKPYRK